MVEQIQIAMPSRKLEVLEHVANRFDEKGALCYFKPDDVTACLVSLPASFATWIHCLPEFEWQMLLPRFPTFPEATKFGPKMPRQ